MKRHLLSLTIFLSLVAASRSDAATITAAPNPATQGQSVAIQVQGPCSAAASAACPMVVDFGDGSLPVTFSAPTSTAGTTACFALYDTSHVYTNPSTGYTVTANRVGIPCGEPSDSGTLLLPVNPPPLLLTLTAAPSALAVSRGDTADRTVTYSFSGTGSATLSSGSGLFRAGATTLGTNPQPLAVTVAGGQGRVSETVVVPLPVIERALQSGFNSFLYERVFTASGGYTLALQLPVVITTGSLANLELKRVELTFPDGRGETTIRRNQRGMTAYARLLYAGSGLLRGFWEVDGRLLARVEQHLLPGGEATLELPAVPPLPTFDEGTHLLRFVVESPPFPSRQPSLVYHVTPDESPERGLQLNASMPPDGAVVPFAELRFVWDGAPSAVLYEITFTPEGGDRPAFSALTREARYTLPLPALNGYFGERGSYQWRVAARDAAGRALAHGGPWKFTFGEPTGR